MNKTVNINLAGLFFHIDENAYAKLQRYLDAIKRSFTDAQGRDEIIQDIEARVAELFSEKIKNERQVIGLKEVDEVIDVMGQPEDYRLDEEIFEDEPQPKATYTSNTAPKKLYRDRDISYIGGVCSGLGHYLGIDTIWVRILFILLTFLTSGGFILVYIVFWIFVPEAVTTAEKLEMRGKPVNIDNIQRKVKEGFENVADTVKNVDYEKYGNKAKKGASGFFSGLGKFLMFCLKVIVKFIGILLIIVGATAVIGLFIGLFTAGTLGFVDGGFGDYIMLFNTSGAPLWLISLLTLLAVGIPFFAIFYLGLKILVNNLKSMSLTAKLTLAGLWIIALIGLGILALRQATAYTVEGETITTKTLNIAPGDTLNISMNIKRYGYSYRYNYEDFKIARDEDGNKALYLDDVRFRILEAKDGQAKIEFLRTARGSSYDAAQDRAGQIDYKYDLNGNTLTLNNYFTMALPAQYRDQDLDIIIYLPEGTQLMVDKNTGHYHRNSGYSGDLLWSGSEDKVLTMHNGKLICADCPADEIHEPSGDGWQYPNEDGEYDFDESLRKKDGVRTQDPMDSLTNEIIDTATIGDNTILGTLKQSNTSDIKQVEFMDNGEALITYAGRKIKARWSNKKPEAFNDFPGAGNLSADFYIEYHDTDSNLNLIALMQKKSNNSITLVSNNITLEKA
ncbi:MAG: hypothetical protein CL868_09545 [Cytophagaceae bacterium]|nr:hypothetical protein [Cytophagaceae bacterium]|tara:strand:- start:9838 stop:11865 length:2028 start_codon:yes stop_codon:yes gene_type:complete